MSKPKIALLCPDVCTNRLGRAYVLWQLLRKQFDPVIVGPDRGRGLWRPLATAGLPVVVVPKGRAGLWEVPASLQPDLLYVVKPLWESLGVGLRHKLHHNIPLMLDVDDIWRAHKLSRYWLGELALHSTIPFLAARTAPSPALAGFYGANLIVPHTRDASVFNPARFDKEQSRAALGLSGVRPVMFLGTPRAHKGLPELASAVAELAQPDVKFVFIDTTPDRSLTASLERLAPGRVVGLPPFSFADLPFVLSAAEAVVLPQQAGLMGRYQFPAKLLDALAMGLPIIASAVGDLPWALGDAGLLYKPGDKLALKAQLARLLDDESLRSSLGLTARARFLERFAPAVIEPELDALVSRALGHAPVPMIPSL